MKTILKLICLITVLLLPVYAFGAGSVVWTTSDDSMKTTNPYWLNVDGVWTSDASGDVVDTGMIYGPVTGEAYVVELSPATGAAIPTTYTVWLKSDAGVKWYTAVSAPINYTNALNYKRLGTTERIYLNNHSVDLELNSAGANNRGRVRMIIKKD